MTLTHFPPDALDDLALRLLDVAASLRKMANLAREKSVQGFQLHGNKAQEWLDHLEHWTFEGTKRLNEQIMRELGARKGQIGGSPRKALSAAQRGGARKKSR
jgi:hypothetical protein